MAKRAASTKTAAPRVRRKPTSDVHALTPTSPSEQEIRTRAFALYEARGSASGDPVADWLSAERELLSAAG
jgi:hypothetical protein